MERLGFGDMAEESMFFFFGQLGEHVELQQHCNLPSSAVRYRWGDGLMIFNYYIFR